MNHDTYDDSYIRGILNTVKTIAMVGASAEGQPAELFRVQVSARARLPHDPDQSRPRRQANCSARRSTRGSPTSPSRSTWSISSAPRTTRVPIVQEALALKPRPRVIWMQLGVRNDEAAALAEANGMKVVMNRCPKIEYGRLSSEIGWMGVNSRTLSSKRAQLLGKRSAAHVAQPHRRSPAARPTRPTRARDATAKSGAVADRANRRTCRRSADVHAVLTIRLRAALRRLDAPCPFR